MALCDNQIRKEHTSACFILSANFWNPVHFLRKSKDPVKMTQVDVLVKVSVNSDYQLLDVSVRWL